VIVVEGEALIDLQIVVIHAEPTGPHPFEILSSRVTVTDIPGQDT
jgi:hypothetical protein